MNIGTITNKGEFMDFIADILNDYNNGIMHHFGQSPLGGHIKTEALLVQIINATGVEMMQKLGEGITVASRDDILKDLKGDGPKVVTDPLELLKSGNYKSEAEINDLLAQIEVSKDSSKDKG